MSQVYVDGKYISCSQADLMEMDRLAKQKGITRDEAAVKVLKLEPPKAAPKAKKGGK